MFFDTITTLNGKTTVRRLKTSFFLWAAFLCILIGGGLFESSPGPAAFILWVLFPCFLLYPLIRLLFFGGRNSGAALLLNFFPGFEHFYEKFDPDSRIILKEEKDKKIERINIRRRKLGYEDLNHLGEPDERSRETLKNENKREKERLRVNVQRAKLGYEDLDSKDF